MHLGWVDLDLGDCASGVHSDLMHTYNLSELSAVSLVIAYELDLLGQVAFFANKLDIFIKKYCK